MNKKGFTLIGLSITLVLAFMFSGISFADDWPCWRGPNSNGISTETGWNPKALSIPKITWKLNVGKGHSCVAVKGNYLYTMGNNAAAGEDAIHEAAMMDVVMWRVAQDLHSPG